MGGRSGDRTPNSTATKISAGALALVALGVVADLTGLWTSVTGRTLEDLIGGSTPEKAPAGSVADCEWISNTNGYTRDVGTPPTSVPKTGAAALTLTTNLGQIRATLDVPRAPCAVASFSYLAGKGFFDNTVCHRLVNVATLKVLQCGDPLATGDSDNDGSGGPSYRFAEENLPVGKEPAYPAGVIAMAKTADPQTTGSQFFIVFGETALDPSYTLLGTVVAGLDVVRSVGAAGHDDAYGSNGGGHPKKRIVIHRATVTTG
ncbi:peptidylprolyl isomerase [Micromonospora matsumotoense]|uniref:peptidylprolyl isomerase n=1 Tax=Micromonospora matsumotoense TaxID=121616 RepID=UPI003422E11E